MYQMNSTASHLMPLQTSSNRYVNCSGGREVEIDVPPTMACAQLNRGAVDAIWPRPSGFVDSPYVLYTSDGSKLPSDPDPNASFLAAAAAAGYVSGIAAALAQTLSAVKATATPTPAP